MKQPPTDKFAQIDQSAQSGAFGFNRLPLPSENQIESGNYKKGKFTMHGLKIAIEQPENSYRTGTDKNGNRWACRFAAHYGYILGTKANDGDHVDCFIGAYPQAENAYIINQTINGVFDEHKVMLGFLNTDHASRAYRNSFSHDWRGLHSIVEVSIKNLKKWLKHGDMTKPLTSEQLPISEVKNMRVQWDENGKPLNSSIAKVIYDLRSADSDGLMLDSVSISDFYHDFGDCLDSSENAYLDSLNVPFSKLSMTANVIKRALNKAGNALQVAESVEGEEANPFISKPANSGGMSIVRVIYRLTDDQTITILFFNPDLTPSKVSKTDTMVAYKWMLNKKDLSILVSPEFGKDVNLTKVAERIMNLANGNMDAFARANKGAAEQIKTITDLTIEIADLENQKTQAKANYEAAKALADEREVAKASEPKAPFTATHTVNDDGVEVPVKMNDEGVWESENGNEYQDYEAEPVANNSVRPIGKSDNGNSTENPNNSNDIDPATLANLNAASISTAIRKKAIAFFEKNPSAKSFDGSGLSKASQKSIMESIKTALFAEITSLYPSFINKGYYVRLADNEESEAVVISVDGDWKLFFEVKGKNLFDSTSTIEDLRAWGFALPFDLDVKAFVANVIKPVVEDFLSKQQAATPETAAETQPTATPSMITQNKIEDAISSLRLETDMTRFNDRLDELADYIESVGLMEQYDKELNELADIAAQMAIENSKKVGG